MRSAGGLRTPPAPAALQGRAVATPSTGIAGPRSDPGPNKEGILTHQPQISVIVPHFNDLSRLDQCLEALCRQTIERDRFEIIVADNGPPSGRAEVDAAIAGRARLADAPIPGAGPARNAGVALSRGEILAFTDCDCIPAPGWLTAGVAALDAADLVGGGMKVLVADEGRMTGTEAFETIFAFNNRRYVEEEHFSITANLLCT
ncbi:MAG: glycosyltransferase family 2 protein, partial [Thermomicrobiales bacterium]